MKQESKELISHLELKYGNNPKTPMQKKTKKQTKTLNYHWIGTAKTGV